MANVVPVQRVLIVSWFLLTVDRGREMRGTRRGPNSPCAVAELALYTDPKAGDAGGRRSRLVLTLCVACLPSGHCNV